jgi:hypothetical protein
MAGRYLNHDERKALVPEQWTEDEIRLRFHHLHTVATNSGAVQCHLDADDLDWILKRGRFAPACTCEVRRSYGPDPIDDAEQDIFCPAHHLPLVELKTMFEEAHSWMPDKTQ